MGVPRYRWRTRFRRRLPWFLIHLGVANKGASDCGAHDWYKDTDAEDRCYHCEVGVRRPSQLGRATPVIEGDGLELRPLEPRVRLQGMDYVFSGLWQWVGTAVLIAVVLWGLYYLIRGQR